MAEGTINLGKASLSLEANLADFVANIKAGKGEVSGLGDTMDSLAAISKIAEDALKQVKLGAGQSAESAASASGIIEGVKGISDEAKAAALELDKVKLTAAQAAETEASASVQAEAIRKIGREADDTTAKVAVMNHTVNNMGGGKSINGTSVGILGAAIGGGALLAPAAGPAIAGLIATLPVMLAGVAGVAGVAALAFEGLGKAIDGDKKAFDKLDPTQQQFVTTIRSMTGELNHLKQVASTDLLPGLTDALHSALSPGTLNAVTTAVGEFATAIGQAGAQWGKYFGSAEFQNIFGPLMQDAARNVGTLSTAALHLFDAFGTLGLAGIPFTNWLMLAIASGAKLADTWIKGEQASGGLATAMSEAEVSLRLVGGLIESLVNAIGALGTALYPVSKVAVKDLSDGFNALAKIINDNKSVIRDLVGTALTGLVEAVKLASDGIKLLTAGLGHIVGDKATIVTAILGIGAAIAIAMGPEAVAITGAILAIGYITDHWKQLSTWFTEFGKATISTFEAMWTAIKGTADLAIYGMLIEVEGLAKGLSAALGWIPGIGGKIKTAMDDVSSFVEQFRKNGVADMQAAGEQMGSAWGNAFLSQTQAALITASAAGQPVSEHGAGQGLPGTGVAKAGTTTYSRAQILSLLLANGVPRDVASNLATISARGEDPSGNIAALNNNPSTGDYSVGLFQENFLGKMGVSRVAQYAPQFGKSPQMSVDAFVQWLGQHPSAQAQIAYQIFQSQGYGAWTTAKGLGITGSGTPAAANPFGSSPAWTTGTTKPPAPPVIPAKVTDLLNRAGVNANQASLLGNQGGTATRYLNDQLTELSMAKAQLETALDSATGKNATQIKTKIASVTKQIENVQDEIKKALLITGDALLPEKLKSQLDALTTKYTADTAYAQVLTGTAATKYAAVIEANLRDQSSVLTAEVASLQSKLKSSTGRQKAAVQDELTKVQGELSDVQSQIEQALQSNVTTLQSKVSTLLGSVTSEFDAQFDAKTQALIDASGLTYFQNGAKTPKEAELAADQAQDTIDSLNAALKQAQATLTTDQADPTVTADQIEQDKLAVTQAQRAIDENRLSIEATAERTKADTDYAADVAKIQADRSAAETAMNNQLAALTDAFANGTGSMSDLTTIASAFGIQINTTTVPDFTNLSTATGDLQTAFGALKSYIEQIIGSFDALNSFATTVDNYGPGGAYGQRGAPQLHAAGAIFTKPTWLGAHDIAGDAGPEALIPLSDPRAVEMFATAAGRADKAGITIQTGPVYGTIDKNTALKWASTLGPALEKVIGVK